MVHLYELLREHLTCKTADMMLLELMDKFISLEPLEIACAPSPDILASVCTTVQQLGRDVP